jgi:hypothetical protein
MPAGQRRNLHGLIGLAFLAAAQLLLLKEVEPIASWFYYFAWWPYILIVDSLIYRIKGNSLLMDRRGEFLVLLLWSVVIWTLFEAVNFVLQNWYYVNVIPLRVIRWPGYALAYATVLPGLFETTELLEALGLFKNSRVKPRVISLSMQQSLVLLGIVSLALVFMFPAYCYPLIWGAFALLLEPVNYRWGTKSILRDLERGTTRMLRLLLTAGLVCGMLWEFWNFWAATKWVYTVPFFEELKLFEMPLLGFLGFPPFTVECYCLYNFISLFRHQRSWEQDSYGLNRHKKVHSGLIMLTVLAGILFCGLIFHAMDTRTALSYWATISDLKSIPTDAARRLSIAGIHTPRMLLARVSSRPQRDAMANILGAAAEDLERWIASAELAELKGMGAQNANLLMSAGIPDVASLAGLDPLHLHERLLRYYRIAPGMPLPPPRPAMVRVWIREANKNHRKGADEET